jgi:antitoxin (DNA-binding transcriptional repressor) of toxin-antitoxin stability system
MQKTVNIHEAKTHLSRLLAELGPDDQIILAKMGKPIAKIVPIQKEVSERPLGFLSGRVTESFFEPLPDEELEGWEG